MPTSRPIAGYAKSRWGRSPALGAGVLVALVPLAVSAHERWFVPVAEQPATDWGALFSLPVALALIGGAVIVGILHWLQRRLGDPLWPRPPFFQRM
jgi:hypothetical protein